MHAANHTSSMLTLINPAVVHNRTKSYPPSPPQASCRDCLFLPFCAGSSPAPSPLRYAASADSVVLNLRSSRPSPSRLRKRLFRPNRVYPYPCTRYRRRPRPPKTASRKPCPNPGTGRQPVANAVTYQSNAHKAEAKRAARTCQEAAETAKCLHPLSQR